MLKVDLKLDLGGGARGRLLKQRGSSLADVFQDPGVIAILLFAVIALAGALFLNWRAEQTHTDVVASVQQAVRDSASLQSELEQARELEERQAAIESRVDKIRDVDHNRYAYVHLMDQVAAAIPSEVWISALNTVRRNPSNGSVTFRLIGFAPTNDVVGAFMQQLELSPFIADVRFLGVSTQSMAQQEVVRFELEGRSELPDISFLETEALGASAPSGEGPEVEPESGPPEAGNLGADSSQMSSEERQGAIPAPGSGSRSSVLPSEGGR